MEGRELEHLLFNSYEPSQPQACKNKDLGLEILSFLLWLLYLPGLYLFQQLLLFLLRLLLTSISFEASSSFHRQSKH